MSEWQKLWICNAEIVSKCQNWHRGREWSENVNVWADARYESSGALMPDWQRTMMRRLGKQRKDLDFRLGSGVNSAKSVEERSTFIAGSPRVSKKELEKLAVSGPIIYADVNLRGVQSWLKRVGSRHK